MAAWKIQRDRPLRNRLAIVTGATGGIGAATALALAGAGAQVVLASRNAARGAAVLDRIRTVHPLAHVSFEVLDLASLGSVQDFCERMAWEHSRIDLLVNIAGVLAAPDRMVTTDGFEMQLGADYLGHFALSLRLLPRLLAAPGARLVTAGRPADGQASLPSLLFALELDRRARAQGWELMSNAAHPGLTPSPAQAAGPTIFAATAPEAEGGVIYGPEGRDGAQFLGDALDREVAARLWEVSERLTGVFADPFRMAA